MASVYDEEGTSHGALEMDHFLGSMLDGYTDFEKAGIEMAQEVIDRGYTKVATMTFPVYAYPVHTIEDAAFRATIEEYNKTAATPIEIVGDATVLEFKPLESSYFLEDGHGDLDAIVGICAGQQFIYPTMMAAKADGSCSADTRLITGGIEKDEDLLADCGDDGTVIFTRIAAPECALFPLVLIDNAVQGKQFADFKNDRQSSGEIIMNSTEDFQTVRNDSVVWDADLSKMAISWEDMKQYFTRYNEGATYAKLVEDLQAVTVESYNK